MDVSDAGTILVVDDEEDILDVVSALLESDGHRCLCARSGDEAVQLLAEEEPHLVLTGLQMAPGDGFLMLEEVRRRYPAAPVVIMTGHGTMEAAIRALRLGSVDFITKPFEVSHLQATVHRNLRLRFLQTQNDQLRFQLKTARGLERLKRDFISNVSHELRTPTVILKEFISILEDRTAGDLPSWTGTCSDFCDRWTTSWTRRVRRAGRFGFRRWTWT